MKKIGEECGVFGMWSPKKQNLPMLAYYGLFALQHRGQEAAGIAVNEDGVFRYHKDGGLVHEVFHAEEKMHRGSYRSCDSPPLRWTSSECALL